MARKCKAHDFLVKDYSVSVNENICLFLPVSIIITYRHFFNLSLKSNLRIELCKNWILASKFQKFFPATGLDLAGLRNDYMINKNVKMCPCKKYQIMKNKTFFLCVLLDYVSILALNTTSQCLLKLRTSMNFPFSSIAFLLFWHRHITMFTCTAGIKISTWDNSCQKTHT